MRHKRIAILIAGLLLCGCTQQEQAQRALIGQMRGAIRDIQSWNDERQAVIDASYAQRRKSLDDAFDADVKEAESLEKDWVIAHRRAYVAALEATWHAQQSSREAHLRTQGNLSSVDDGLARLGAMSELREDWAEEVQRLGKEVANAGH